MVRFFLFFIGIAISFSQINQFSLQFAKTQFSGINGTLRVVSHSENPFVGHVTLVLKSKKGLEHRLIHFEEDDENVREIEVPALVDDAYELYVIPSYVTSIVRKQNQAPNTRVDESERYRISETYTMAFSSILHHFDVIPSKTNPFGNENFNVTVIAKDADGNTITDYDGIVDIYVDDEQLYHTPIQTASGDFQSGTPGETVLNFAYSKNGDITIEVRDNANASIIGESVTISVQSPADHFNVELLEAGTSTLADTTDIQVGTAYDVRITAKDASDITMTAYEGDVKIGSTFSNITGLPNSITFTLAENGVYTISNVTIYSAENGRIYASGKGTNSLIAYYTFENSVTDRAFNQHTGLTTNITYQSSKSGFGQAGYFTGSNSYVEIPDHSELRLTNYTILAWINYDASQPNGQSMILGKGTRGGNPANNNQMLLDPGTGSDYRHRYSGINGANIGLNRGSSTAGTWTHFTIRLDGTSVSSIINGSTVYTSTGSASQEANSEPFYFGREGNGSNRYKGLMDNVIIFNYALTDAEVLDIYNTNDPIRHMKSKTGLLTVNANPVLANLEIEIPSAEFKNGVPFNIVVRGVDQFGNPLTNYAGPVNLSVSGGTGSLNKTKLITSEFLNGEATTSISYNRGETISIVVTDSADASYNVTSASIDIENVADHFKIELLDQANQPITTVPVETSFKIRITAEDGTNTTLTNYEGTITIGNGFTGVTGLPTEYTFSVSDNGVKEFSDVKISGAGTGYIYASAVGTQGLVAYYDFEGDATDRAYGKHTAENTNVTFVDDETSGATPPIDLGNVAYFSGTSFLKIADDPELRLTDYTISAWVYFNYVDQPNNQSSIFTKGDRNGDPANNNQLLFDKNGKDFRHRMSATDGINQGANGYVLTEGQWQLLTIRLSGTQLTNFVDGVSVDSFNASNPQDPNDAPHYIGRSVAENSYQFAGYIGDVTVYNYGLSDAEVSSLFSTNNPILPLASKSPALTVTGSSVLAGLEIDITGTEFFNGVNFPIKVRGVDQYGNNLTSYNGPILLTVNGGVGTIDDSKIESGLFTNGEATIYTFYNAGGAITITATDSTNAAYTKTSATLTFNSTPDHFELSSSLGNEIIVGESFNLTITPKTSGGSTLANYYGTVKLGSTFKHITGFQNSIVFQGESSKTISNITVTAEDSGYFYASAIGVEGLIAHYDFEGNSNDAAFGSLDASNTNVVFQSVGDNSKLTTAGYFDGNNSYLKIDDQEELRVSNYTMLAWFKLDGSQPQAQQMILGKGTRNLNPANNNQMLIDQGTGTDFRHRFSATDGVNVGLNPASNASLNTWYHFAIRLDGTSAASFINGSTKYTYNSAAGQAANNADFYIGVEGDLTDDFKGWIDEVILYNYALSDAEIDSIYANGNPVEPIASKSSKIRVSSINHTFVSSTTAGTNQTLTLFRPSNANLAVSIESSDQEALIEGTAFKNLSGTKYNTTLDATSKLYTVQFRSSGTRYLYIYDQSTQTIRDTVVVTVNPSSHSDFRVELEDSPTGDYNKNDTYDISVTAIDTYGNTITSYTNTVSFSASLGGFQQISVNMPSDYTFVAGDNGTHTFVNGISFSGSGSSQSNNTITAADAGTPSLNGTTSAFNITSSSILNRYEFRNLSGTQVTDKSVSFTVQAIDNTGADITSSDYDGLNLTLYSINGTDTTELLTGINTTNGVYSGAVDIHTVGSYRLYIRFPSPLVEGTSSVFSVNPGELETIDVSFTSTRLTSGETSNLTLTLKDSLGNVKTDYVGDISVTSDATTAGFNAYLVAYYSFNNSNANDETGNGYNGTESNISYVDNTAGVGFGKAASFNGSNSQISIPHNTALNLANGYTISAWARLSNTHDEDQASVVGKGHRTGGATPLMIYGDALATPDLRHRVKTSATANDGENGFGLNHNQWYHIAIVYNGNEISNYVNGVLVDGPRTLSAAVQNNTDPFYIGVENSNSQSPRFWFTGLIDEVKIYNKALTASEIASDKDNILFNRVIVFTGSENGVRTLPIGFDRLGSTAINISGQSASLETVNAQVTGIEVTPFAYTVTLPNPMISGTAEDIQIDARSISGTQGDRALNSISLTSTSTDGVASLPPVTSYDTSNGQKTISNGLTFNTAGMQTYTVTDNEGATGQSSVTVNSTQVTTQFLLSANKETMVAGSGYSVTVTAKDVGGNTVATYQGEVQFSITDLHGSAVKPSSDLIFSLSDNGVKTYTNLNFVSSGEQIITVSDKNNSSILGRDTLTVFGGAPSSISFTNLTDNVNENTSYTLGVSATDLYGNIAESYLGTVRLSIAGNTEHTETFTLADKGHHTFSSVQFTTAEGSPQNVTIVDVNNAGFTQTKSVGVVPDGVATDFQVIFNGGTNPVAGADFNMTLRTVDGNNQMRNYTGDVTVALYGGATGTIHGTNPITFSADSEFVFIDYMNLTRSNLDSVTFTGSVGGLSKTVVVNVDPAVASSSVVTLEESDYYSVGEKYDVTIELLDAYGNRATTSTNTVTFTDETYHTTPSNYVFTLSDAGIKTLADTVEMLATQTNATVAVTGPAGTSANFNISSSTQATYLEVTGFNTSTTAGSLNSLTIQAKTADGSDATSATGDIQLELLTSVSGATLEGVSGTPSLGAGGAVTLSNVHIDSAGVFNIKATLVGSSPAVSGTRSNITMFAGTPTDVVFTIPATTATSGDLVSATLELKDSYGNRATNFTGNVTLTSNEDGSHTQTLYTPASTGNNQNGKLIHALSVSGIATNSGSAFVDNSTDALFHPAEGVRARYQGSFYTWAKVSAPSNGYFNLTGVPTGRFRNDAIYVYSDVAKAVDFAMSGDNAFKLYVNGTRVINSPNASGNVSTIGQKAEDVPLQAGWNILVVSVQNTAGSSYYYTLGAYKYDETLGSTYASGTPASISYTNDYGHFVPQSGYPITFSASDYGIRTFKTSFLTLGTRTLTASYGGDSENAGLTVTPATLTLSTPSEVTANDVFNVTAQTHNYLNQFDQNTVSGLSLSLSSGDPQAILPGAQNPVNGTATFNGVLLKTSGTQTLTVTDGTVSKQSSLTVNSNLDASQFTVTANPSPVIAGNTYSLTIEAKDVGGNPVSNYVGTVTISTSEEGENLYTTSTTFTLSDGGKKTLTGNRLKRATTHTLTVTDNSDNSITGSTSLLVRPGAPTQLAYNGLTTNVTQNAPYNITVEAHDQYNNIATSYIGTIELRVPGTDTLSYAYQLADAGTHTFNGILFGGAPESTVTVSAIDQANSSYTISKVVTIKASGVATDYLVSIAGGDTLTAGDGKTVTLTAIDGTQSVVTSYTGTASFSTTATDYNSIGNTTSFSNGVATVPDLLRIRSAGTFTIRFTDATNGIDHIKTVRINPTTEAYVHLALEEQTNYVVNQAYDLVLTVKDTFNNTVEDYASTVTFADNADVDYAQASIPFHTDSNGIARISNQVTFLSTSTPITIGASNFTDSTLSVSNIISEAAHYDFSVYGFADPILAGVKDSVIIVARDLSQTPVDITGENVRVTSTDGLDTTFVFSGTSDTLTMVSFNTVGTHYIHAERVSNTSIYGRQTGISVTSNTVDAIELVLSGGLRHQSGKETELTITLKDEFGNIKTDYNGSVTLSSNENASVGITTYPISQTTNNQNGKIKHFLSVTGIPSNGGSYDEFVDGVNTANFHPVPGTFARYNGTNYPWTKETDTDGHFATSASGYRFKNSVVYVYSATGDSVDIAVSWDSGYGLYVNGSFKGSATSVSANAQNQRGALYPAVLNAGWNTILLSGRRNGGTIRHSLAIYKSGQAGSTSYATGTAATQLLYTNDYPFFVPNTNRTISFSASDLGSKTVKLAFSATGTRSITADISGNPTETLNGISVTPYGISVSNHPTNVNAGDAFSATYTLTDVLGNTATSLPSGLTLSFNSTDGSATLPSSVTESAFTNGVYLVNNGFTLNTGGNQAITSVLKDGSTTLTSVTTDSIDVAVTALANALKIEMVGGLKQSGRDYDITITAIDGSENRVSDYTGTIRFTITDTATGVVIPSEYTFTAGDLGQHTFTNGVRFIRSGSTTLTVQDKALSYINGQRVETVIPDAVSNLKIELPQTTVTDGNPFSFTVNALDQFGNTVDTYIERIKLLADSEISLAVSGYTYQTSDYGRHVFTGNSATPVGGPYQFKVSENDAGSVVDSDSVQIYVVASGTATTFAYQSIFNTSDTLEAGVTYSDSIFATDDNGTKDINYNGNVRVTVSDNNAILMPNNEILNFSSGETPNQQLFRFATVGNQTITLTDTQLTTLTSTKSIYVKNGAAAQFLVTLPDDTLVTNGTYDVTLTAQDVYGNLVSDYRGTVLLSTSNTNSTLTSKYRFTGQENGSVVLSDAIQYFGTSINTTITATDSANSSITGASSPFVVEGTPFTMIEVEPIASYQNDVYFTSSNDTALFVAKINNPTGNSVTLSGLNLAITASHTFTTYASNLRLIIDANKNGRFEETATVSNISVIGNTLQINGFTEPIASSGDIRVALFATVAGQAGQTVTRRLTLNTATDLVFQQAVDRSTNNIPLAGPLVTVEEGVVSGKLFVGAGSNAPTSKSITNDVVHEEVLQFKLTNTTIERMRLDTVRFSLDGTLSLGTDLDSAALILDKNNDGVYTVETDSIIQTRTSFAGSTIEFAQLNGYALSISASNEYLLSVSLNGNASANETLSFGLTIGSIKATGLTSSVNSGNVDFQGTPISGATFTIQDYLILSENTIADQHSDTGIAHDSLLVMDFNLASPNSVMNIRDIIVTVQVAGTPISSTVSNIRLYRDVNTNNVYDSGTDVLIKNGVVSGSTLSFTDINHIINNTTDRLKVQVDINTSATGGTVYDFRILSSNQITMNSGQVSTNNFAIKGLRLDYGYQVGTTSISDGIIIRNQSNVSALKLNFIDAIPSNLTAITFTEISGGSLADISAMRLIRESDGQTLGTIVTPSVNGLHMNLTDASGTLSGDYRLDIDFGGFEQNQSYQFRVVAKSDIYTQHNAEISTQNFPLTGATLTHTSRYKVNDYPNAAPIIDAGERAWFGAFTFVPQSGASASGKTLTQLAIENAYAASGGTFDHNDIDSVLIFTSDDPNTNPLLGGAILRSAIIMTDNGAGGRAPFTGLSIPLETSGNPTAVHIVYRMSSAMSQSNVAGVTLPSESDVVFNVPITSQDAYPIAFQQEYSLPVEIKDFELSAHEEGLHVKLETASEDGAVAIEIERVELDFNGNETDERHRITTFKFDPSTLRTGRIYTFMDKKAAYGKSYTYTPIEVTESGDRVPLLKWTKTIERPVPTEFGIGNAYPNPANPNTTLKFALPENSVVNVVIYNVLGQLVKSFKDINYDVGYQKLTWHGENTQNKRVSSGIYFFKIDVEGVRSAKRIEKIQKVVLLK